jgi:Domain of unknown function (DUF4118)
MVPASDAHPLSAVQAAVPAPLPSEVRMHISPRSRLVAYGIAVLGTAVCLLARWPLWPVLGYRHPYLTCLPAILISAYYGGWRPGLLAVLLGALGTQCFLMEPLYSLSLAKANVGLLYFLLVGTILGWNEALIRRRRAEEELRQVNARLDLAVRGSNLAIWECDVPDGRIEDSHLTLSNVWESLVIGEQSGPTSASKTDPPGFRGTPVWACSRGRPVTLLLLLGRLVATVPPPGETESGSAGTQPDKG